MRGQYFSFDAVVATVIMTIAMTSLAAYWFGAQSVVDSRANPLYDDAMRIGDSLLSPGVPANWERGPLEEVRQFGLADGFSNTLSTGKVVKFNITAGDLSAGGGYEKAGNIMRAPADYFIWIEQTDDPSQFYQMGRWMAPNASEVAVAYRGVAMTGADGRLHPARMRVFLWR